MPKLTAFTSKLEGKELLFDGSSLTPACDERKGIYCWENTLNGKLYVGLAGGAKGLRGRLSAELEDNGSGTPSLLKSALGKYGKHNFLVKLVVSTEVTDALGYMEIAVIAALNSQAPNGYNITEGGKGTLGFSNVSGADLRRGTPNPAVAKAKAKRYELVSPEGVRHYVVNMTAFCLAKDLNPAHMMQVANSAKPISHKGWTSGCITREAYAEQLSSVAYFVNGLNDELVRVSNIKRFALANGAQQGALNGVWLKRPSYNSSGGWRRATEAEIASFNPKVHRTWHQHDWLPLES